jgi:hypothetical protein
MVSFKRRFRASQPQKAPTCKKTEKREYGKDKDPAGLPSGKLQQRGLPPQAVVSVERLFQSQTPYLAEDDQLPRGCVIPEDVQHRHEKDKEDEGYLGNPSIGCHVHDGI